MEYPVEFESAFARVIGHEGKFQKDTSDRGNWTSGKVGVGELKGTNFGISSMTYPELDIENLSVEEAKAIYYKDWWVVLGLDKFPSASRFQLFDSAINHGMHNTTRMLQRSVSVKDDGKIGPITMKAVQASDLNDLLMGFLAERLDFMTNVSTWGSYGKGWARRISTNLRYATRDN